MGISIFANASLRVWRGWLCALKRPAQVRINCRLGLARWRVIRRVERNWCELSDQRTNSKTVCFSPFNEEKRVKHELTASGSSSLIRHHSPPAPHKCDAYLQHRCQKHDGAQEWKSRSAAFTHALMEPLKAKDRKCASMNQSSFKNRRFIPCEHSSPANSSDVPSTCCLCPAAVGRQLIRKHKGK